MKIILIAPYKESVSVSMHVYANNLHRVYTSLGYDTSILSYPVSKGIGGKKVHDRWTRYVLYPRKLFFRRRDADTIYHIVDHSYAYLVFFVRGKVVVTCHDVIPLKFKEHVGTIAYVIFRGIISCLKYASGIIVDSLSTKQDLLQVIGSRHVDKIVTVPLGYNQDIFSYTQKHNPGTVSGKYKILLVGKHFYKNILQALAALVSIPEISQKIELVKVLDFTKEESDFIHTRLPTLHTTVHSHVVAENMGNLYRDADILLFPSIYEGFGMPILEAMACGTPVITSNCSSMPEVGGDAALYVDPYNTADIAEKIQLLMNDKTLYAGLQQAGLERVKEFTREKSAQQLLSLYARCIKIL